MPLPGSGPPALVTVDVFTVPGRHVPAALLGLAGQRRRLAAGPGVRFGKLLGTASGRSFAARDLTVTRWVVLCSWEPGARTDSPVHRRWAARAAEHWRAELLPLSSRGHWSGYQPFTVPDPTPTAPGPVLALTRARLAWTRLPRFHRAVPAVSADLQAAAGLLLAFGIGEAPVGRQGTLSLWASAAALTEFAYRRPAHRRVVAAAGREGWYTEELFARFAVLASAGTVGGRAPLPG